MTDQLATDIISKIASHAQMESETITRDTELTELGIHSLELTEIIFDVEDQYGLEIDLNTADAWANLKTVGDIVDAVRRLIDAKG